MRPDNVPRHAPAPAARGAGAAGLPRTVYDGRWAGAAWSAVGCSALFLTLLLAVDGTAAHLTAAHAALWAGLALLLFVVLIPARVSVGPGRLTSRGLLRERTVRTDQLVSLRWSEGVAERLVLRDTDGSRVELDPRVLIATPQLWHQLDRDARASLRDGTLRYGATALQGLAKRLDGETAHLVFRQSGLD